MLLASPDPVTFAGKYYKVQALRMTPALDPKLFPGLLISGSSEAGLARERAICATPVQYPKPTKEYESAPPTRDRAGIRVGIIARPTSAEAWSVAIARFHGDRKG